MDNRVCEVRLLVDPASLEKRDGAPIWGQVSFSVGEDSFPDAGWTDIAVGFCAYWLDALRRLASESTTTESVFFMDGPFRADLRLASPDTIELSLVCSRKDDDKVEYRTKQNVRALIRDALSSAESLLDVADRNGWADNDVRALRGAIDSATPYS